MTMLVNANPQKLARQSGFTLIEIMISVIIVGLIGLSLSLNSASLTGMFRFAAEERQYAISNNVMRALLEHADNVGNGRLSTPQNYSFQGVNYRSAPARINQAGNTLVDYLVANNVNPEHAIHDGSASRRVRVYQRDINNIDVPVGGYFGSSTGTTVRLTYDIAAIYHTQCGGQEACMTSGGRPGDSPTLTSTNFSTWNTSGTDGPPVTFSTQAIQLERWKRTHQRLTEVRNSLADLKTTRMFTASAEDVLVNNFNPVPNTHQTGRNPGTNDDCYSAWVPLNGSNSVLPQVGLNAAIHGVTAWGGRAEYCPNYSTSHNGENEPPFNAAIRIDRHVTAGNNPVNSGQNIYYIF